MSISFQSLIDDIRSNNPSYDLIEFNDETLDFKIEAKQMIDFSEALAKNNTLKGLWICLGSGNYLDSHQNPDQKLKLEEIGNFFAYACAKALKENITLETLAISDININDTGAIFLAQALSQNKTLNSLRILSDNITDNGAKNFLEELKYNTSLTHLALSFDDCLEYGEISESKIEDTVVKEEIQKLLYRNEQLKENEIDGGYVIPHEDQEIALQLYGQNLPEHLEE